MKIVDLDMSVDLTKQTNLRGGIAWYSMQLQKILWHTSGISILKEKTELELEIT